MAFPLIMLYANHGKFLKKRAKKIALWNSIVVGAFFCILTIFIDSASTTWNAAPAALYYWINRSILIDRTANHDNKTEFEQDVLNNSMPITSVSPMPNGNKTTNNNNNCDEYKRKYESHQTTAEINKIEINGKVAEIQFCRICGSKLPKDANFCSKCGTKISICDK